jgi:hypothetical protein
MNTQRWTRVCTAFMLFGLPLAAFTQAPKQAPPEKANDRLATIQSELDYLRSAKVPISFELTEVTIREAYDRIAASTLLSIAYEGDIDPGSKHVLSFKDTQLKEVLEKLAKKFMLTYRVDAPDRLTVIGPKLK